MDYIDQNTKEWVTMVKSYSVDFFHNAIMPMIIESIFGNKNKKETKKEVPKHEEPVRERDTKAESSAEAMA